MRMYDSVPTRAERIAAVVGLVGLAAATGAAVLGFVLAALLFFFVAITCGTIAKARVDLESLLEFGICRVPEDDPRAERYRERRRREETAIQDRIERLDDRLASRPGVETAFLLGIGLVGVGALAAVPFAGEQRTAGYLLVVALIGINAALIGYAASRIDPDDG